MRNIALSVLFDENYLEPALVTILDLIRYAPENIDIVLVYITSNDKATNDEVQQIIVKLIDKISKIRNIQAISIQSKIFNKFEKFHFTNSILYKLILPEILEYEFIINIDAGFLSGDKIDKFFNYIENLIYEDKFLNSAIGAICLDSTKQLPAVFAGIKHNSMYPTAGILFFNSRIYKKSNLFQRLIDGYHLYKDDLIWAEQDLLCLVTLEGELYNIDLHEYVLLENLSIQGFLESQTSSAYSTTFMLYKITGTLKPWKIWVLDPKRKFYLERRESFKHYINFNDYQIIQNNNISITHLPLYRAFLIAYEQNILRLTVQKNE